MNKLEFKYFAPYLPFYPVIRSEQGNNYNVISDVQIAHIIIHGRVSEIVMALRPLSDLTKEIEYNGEKFVPIERLSEYSDHEIVYESGCVLLKEKYSFEQDVLGAPLAIIEDLLKWRFDIYELIPKGLAVDINTLNYENNFR